MCTHPKEALSLAWVCQTTYQENKSFDHKPVVSLLENKSLDSLPPRVFHLQLMRLQYSISHMPGKTLYMKVLFQEYPQQQISVIDHSALHASRDYLDSYCTVNTKSQLPVLRYNFIIQNGQLQIILLSRGNFINIGNSMATSL